MNEDLGSKILRVVVYIFLGIGIVAGVLVGWIPLSRDNRGIILGCSLVLIVIGLVVEYAIRRPRLNRLR